ncbi:MAG: hypothetical protein E7214_04245 [Clostridium sp.]|nr:hypothetical protein [Clostridium sp.]
MYFVSFEKIKKDMFYKVGGKGYNLKRAIDIGMNVPCGGVVTSDFYRKYIQYNDLEEDIKNLFNIVNEDNVDSMIDTIDEIHNRLLSGKFSDEMKESILKEINICSY